MDTDGQGHVVPEAGQPITILDVRCACGVCGAHTIAWQGRALSGWCPNCGSYDVRALPVLH